MLSAEEALRRQREGNRRFAAGIQEKSSGRDEGKCKELLIVGAEFSLESGEVDFLGGVPAGR